LPPEGNLPVYLPVYQCIHEANRLLTLFTLFTLLVELMSKNNAVVERRFTMY